MRPTALVPYKSIADIQHINRFTRQGCGLIWYSKSHLVHLKKYAYYLRFANLQMFLVGSLKWLYTGITTKRNIPNPCAYFMGCIVKCTENFRKFSIWHEYMNSFYWIQLTQFFRYVSLPLGKPHDLVVLAVIISLFLLMWRSLASLWMFYRENEIGVERLAILWRYQMESFFRVTGPLGGKFTVPRWIPLTKDSDALMFSLISAWANGWVTNRDASDLRRHRAHHDVTVMKTIFCNVNEGTLINIVK